MRKSIYNGRTNHRLTFRPWLWSGRGVYDFTRVVITDLKK